MKNDEKQKERLRHAIMTTIKANGLPITGDFWLMLIFRTQSELRHMAQELNIQESAYQL